MTNQPAAQPVKKSLSAVRVEPQSVAVADGTNGLTIAASEVASQPDTVKVAIPAKKHKPLHPGKDQGDEDQGETEGGHSPSVIHQEAAAEGQSAEAGSAPASEPMSNTADAIGGAALAPTEPTT